MNVGSLTWRVTPDLLCVADAGGVFRHTNPAWFRTLGRLPEDIESRPFFDFVHPDDYGVTQQAFIDLQRGLPVLQFENRYRHKDGSYRWLSWNAVPEADHFFCNARDITRAKETERALASETAQAHLREQFISILGHDLRNPLAAAICAVEFMEREEMSDRAKIVLGTANQSMQRMSALIDDVLDFARSRLGGTIGVDPIGNIDLAQVLSRAAAEISMAHPDITLEERYDLHHPVTCDPDRIAQLVSNLLGNAVFHGEPGGRVCMTAQDRGDRVSLSITNRGGTIPPAIKHMLFEPFKRADPACGQNGLGLGLFIAKQIANGHGADLDVCSEAGETTFTLTLPREIRQVPMVEHRHAS
ncbi:PAS domain-containing sensor histidine kinase [Jannaschia sp. M317]|uniref:PAS domain-containing sensor histidine kinase n=1 Tax=Jannaschia sp. M317 TaxID=2867011 RepID=UPI0021A4E5E9|nr:PAS domain-containing sensor histidine kinase [Jannaschia sp. M317]UWQ17288.1 PAS domain-containing sensor histidine kinase [Jannaschia sp. M317]